MKNIKKVEKDIFYYQENFRHPKLEKFEISGLYDLFPELKTVFKVEKSWPEKWIFCGEAGVYIFFDEHLEIVYIGKANHFGERFGKYFSHGNNKKCNLKNSWKSTPRYIVTVKVPKDSKFENSALESCLLSKISTTDNKLENKW